MHLQECLFFIIRQESGNSDVQADILPSSNAGLMLDFSFTDEEALNGYAVHPDHVKIKDGIIGPNVKSRVCIDYVK